MDKKDFYVNVRYKYDKAKDKNIKKKDKDKKVKTKSRDFVLLVIIIILAIVCIVRVNVFLIAKSIQFFEAGNMTLGWLELLIFGLLIVGVGVDIYYGATTKNFYCIEFKKYRKKIYIMNSLIDKDLDIERFNKLDKFIYKKTNGTKEEVKEAKAFVYGQLKLSMKYNKRKFDKIILAVLTGILIPLLVHNMEGTKKDISYIVIFIFAGVIYSIVMKMTKGIRENLTKIEEIIDVKILENSSLEK